MRTVIEKISALFLLIFTIPVVLFFGLLIKVKYPGPLFYKQVRVGQYGKRFHIYKLRTMVANASEILQDFLLRDEKRAKEWQENACLKDDPRIAGLIAKIARKLSVDELPQLWNIVKGDMSFIGPRPQEVSFIDSLDEHDRELRQSVKPGLTGLWQVGPRDNVTYRQMVRYDKFYIQHKGFWLNLRIVFRTFYVVFKMSGT